MVSGDARTVLVQGGHTTRRRPQLAERGSARLLSAGVRACFTSVDFTLENQLVRLTPSAGVRYNPLQMVGPMVGLDRQWAEPFTN